jgi:hypothetical protein
LQIAVLDFSKTQISFFKALSFNIRAGGRFAGSNNALAGRLNVGDDKNDNSVHGLTSCIKAGWYPLFPFNKHCF